MSSPPGSPAPARGPADADKSATGISQFLGRVLDQLSVSAWLPSIMLIGNIALLVQLNSQGDLDVGRAVLALTQRPLGILVVLLLGFIIGTMLTQAFQFEAIRLLEGYWKPGRLRSAISDRRIRRHAARRDDLEQAYASALTEAFRCALQEAVTKDVPPEDIAAMRLILRDGVADTRVIAIENADIAMFWTRHSAPEKLRRVEALRSRRRDYPDEDRILPTRLGNALRAREDLLKNVDGELEGFVIKNYDDMPNHLRLHHEQYRNRLDMYCSLVLVFGVLAVAGFALLANDGGAHVVAGLGALFLYAVLAMVSYAAAIASARGYGALLVMIDERLGEAKRAERSRTVPRWNLSVRRDHGNPVLRALRRRH